jgi:hypothetical protein
MIPSQLNGHFLSKRTLINLTIVPHGSDLFRLRFFNFIAAWDFNDLEVPFLIHSRVIHDYMPLSSIEQIYRDFTI